MFPVQITSLASDKRIEIDPAGTRADRRGWTYLFCAILCHRLFMAQEDRYLCSERVIPTR